MNRRFCRRHFTWMHQRTGANSGRLVHLDENPEQLGALPLPFSTSQRKNFCRNPGAPAQSWSKRGSRKGKLWSFCLLHRRAKADPQMPAPSPPLNWKKKKWWFWAKSSLTSSRGTQGRNDHETFARSVVSKRKPRVHGLGRNCFRRRIGMSLADIAILGAGMHPGENGDAILRYGMTAEQPEHGLGGKR